MELQGYFTNKGLALAAKLASGATLKITRVTAGAGKTENPSAAASLPLPKQQLAVNPPLRRGNTAVLPVTLAAALASSAYELTELGVFAQDPNEGEILYKLYKLPEAMKVDPTSCLVLRFYLEETVSQDLGAKVVCSPAGLITEPDFAPVRDKVELADVPARVVNLAASEFQAYLDSLPRLVTEALNLKVTGELSTAVELSRFYGPGSITIDPPGSGFTLKNTLSIMYCALPVTVYPTNFQEPENSEEAAALVDIDRCGSLVKLHGCSFTGLGTASKYTGVRASYGSGAVMGSCHASGLNAVAQASNGASITVGGSDSSYQDNKTGAYVWHGGTIMLTSPVPDTLGGSVNLKQGGLIVKSNGTLL